MPTFSVFNLSNDVEYTYSMPSHIMTIDEEITFRVDSLIRTHMLENKQASQLHNPLMLDSYRNQVVLGRVSASLGDFAVYLR